MTSCRFHPDRKAVVRCEKFEYGYCQECLNSCAACTDPALYCRHRTACIIWELCRGEIKKRRQQDVSVDVAGAESCCPLLEKLRDDPFEKPLDPPQRFDQSL